MIRFSSVDPSGWGGDETMDRWTPPVKLTAQEEEEGISPAKSGRRSTNKQRRPRTSPRASAGGSAQRGRTRRR
jgi:hypothetical protein